MDQASLIGREPDPPSQQLGCVLRRQPVRLGQQIGSEPAYRHRLGFRDLGIDIASQH